MGEVDCSPDIAHTAPAKINDMYNDKLKQEGRNRWDVLGEVFSAIERTAPVSGIMRTSGSRWVEIGGMNWEKLFSCTCTYSTFPKNEIRVTMEKVGTG